MTPPNVQLSERYESMWRTALPQIKSGAIDIDPTLASSIADARRGLTLIFRPAEPVRATVLKFVERLKAIEPDQHYCTASDLHLTVLSLFTVTEQPEQFSAQTASYVAAAESAVREASCFEIDFRGITISPGAVLVQGFPRNAELEKVRERLRTALHDVGLTRGLDTRYRLITAHLTIARFKAPLQDPSQFANLLEHSREISFGVSQVTELSLLKNDWYMSAASQELLRNYTLAHPPQ